MVSGEPIWADLVEVPEVFHEVNFHIPKTHLRGISIRQLEELQDLIADVLDSGLEHYDKFSNERVTRENINLYHICDLFIKPLTENEQCSYVEMMADSDDQEPTWFVSHWWGTNFFDTVRMLKLHAAQRGVSEEDEYYWICAFANCQHNLEELNTDDYLDTPFARAIMGEKCQGTVCILNESKATPFTRSWCVFEAFISTTHGKIDKETPHALDFATIIPEGDCEADDGTFNQRCAGLLYELQAEDRDEFDSALRKMDETTDHPGEESAAWFPKDVSKVGAKVDILKAKATMDKDHQNILRWVGDRVDEVNVAIRRKFIRPALYMACTEIADPNFMRELMEGGVVTKEEAVKIAHEEGCLNAAASYVGKDQGNSRDNAGCVRYMLQMGYNPNPVDDDDDCALESAFVARNYDSVRVLLDFGADASLVNADHIDFDECPEDVYELLVQQGVANE